MPYFGIIYTNVLVEANGGCCTGISRQPWKSRRKIFDERRSPSGQHETHAETEKGAYQYYIAEVAENANMGRNPPDEQQLGIQCKEADYEKLEPR